MANGAAAELDALERAVNDAAGRAYTLWVSYLTLGTYMVIAVGSVTHAMLFLETAMKLPVFNVELPLLGFFFVAPFFFLIIHVYTLLQLAILVRRAREYESKQEEISIYPVEKEARKRRLDSFVVLQAAIGPDTSSPSLLGLSLQAMVLVTIVAAPVMLLLFVQITFLPYHHESITWTHRILLGLDLAFIWLFWPEIRVSRKSSARAVSWLQPLAAKLATTAVAYLALFGAVFPGEALYPLATCPIFRIEETNGAAGVGATESAKPLQTRTVCHSLVRLLFEGEIDELKGRPRGFFANMIIVSGQSFVDEEKLRKQTRRPGYRNLATRDFFVANPSLDPEFVPMNSFRGRDLRRAILDRTDLRQSDFSGADLSNASLRFARVDGSRFGCADEHRPHLFWDQSAPGASEGEDYPGSENHCPRQRARFANLSDAVLDKASLTYSTFEYTVLHRARLIETNLRETLFVNAQMQGAWLNKAFLQGALLDGSRLDLATLSDVKLHGASLVEVNMQGVKMQRAILHGANIASANLQGSDLQNSQFQGSALGGASVIAAELHSADLSGASLVGTYFQGAGLTKTNFAAATLGNTYVWQAKLGELDSLVKPLLVFDLIGIDRTLSVTPMISHLKDFIQAPKDPLTQMLELAFRNVDDLVVKALIWRRLPILAIAGVTEDVPPLFHFLGPDSKQETIMPNRKGALLNLLLDISCAPPDGAYVLKSLINTGEQLRHLQGQLQDFAATVSDDQACPAAKALTADEREKLGKLVNESGSN